MAQLGIVFLLGFTLFSQFIFIAHCRDKIFITDVLDGKIFVGENIGPDFHGENITEVPLIGLQAPVGIDYDYRSNNIYWTDEDARTVNRASLDGSDQETVIDQSHGIGFPQGIVLDLILNKMFWSDTLLEHIMSADLDGSNRLTIINSGLYRPWGIALSQKRRKLYWTDQGVSTGKIEMSNKDGTSRSALVTTRLQQPQGLALDFQEQRLYWTEKHYDVIESVDLDDLSDRTTHVYAERGDLVVFGISLYFTSIYYTDFSSRGLHEADVGAEEIRDITGFTEAPSHVRIYTDLTCSASCPGNSRCQLVAYNTPGCVCIYGWGGLNCGTRIICTLPDPPPQASFLNPADSYTASTTVTVKCDNGNDQVQWTCNGYTGKWDEDPIDCPESPGIICTLPDPPSHTSFLNPADSYTAGTTVTVKCDNSNDQVQWTCNGYTGKWDEDPIDCPESPGSSAGLTAGIAAAACFFLLLLIILVIYRSKRKPQRSPSAPVQPTAQSTAQPTAPSLSVIYNAGAQPTIPVPPPRYNHGPSAAMSGSTNPERKSLEQHDYESTMDMLKGPSGVAASAAYPPRYGGRQPGPNVGMATGGPPPYTSNVHF